MRPVDRGQPPDVAVREYGDLRPHLTDRLGWYCSYCEIPIQSHAHVEHIVAKDPRPDLVLQWDNLLLSCTHCDSIKGREELDLGQYFWPDRDNTARALEYHETGSVTVSTGIDGEAGERAKRTLKLTGLDRRPGHCRYSRKDMRWHHRQDAWGRAERARANLSKDASEPMRRQVVETAQSAGFWSVWMTVFRDDRDMLRRFIDAFPGTATDCFDGECRCVARPGGAL